MQGFHYPLPQALRQCVAGVALPAAPGKSGSVLQESHCPLPPAVRKFNAGAALPTALGQ